MAVSAASGRDSGEVRVEHVFAGGIGVHHRPCGKPGAGAEAGEDRAGVGDGVGRVQCLDPDPGAPGGVSAAARTDPEWGANAVTKSPIASSVTSAGSSPRVSTNIDHQSTLTACTTRRRAH
jgi:hypothetical protein